MIGIKIGSSGNPGVQANLPVASVRVEVGLGPGRVTPNPGPPAQAPGGQTGSSNPGPPAQAPGGQTGSSNPGPPAPVPGGRTGSSRPNTPGSNVPSVPPGPTNPNSPGSGNPISGAPGNGNTGETGTPQSGNGPAGPGGPGNGNGFPQVPGQGNPYGNPQGPGNANVFPQMPGQGNPYSNPQGPSMNPGQTLVGNATVPGGIVYGQPGLGPPTNPSGLPGAVNQQVLPAGIQSELTAAVDYLNGRNDGGSLLPGTRQLLRHVEHSVGHSAVRDFIAESGRHGTEALGRILHQANQTAHDTGGHHSQSQIRSLTNELLNTVQLTKHLSQLEQAGGPAVQRARDASLSLYAGRAGAPAMAPSYGPAQMSVAELLRDVRSGAFLQPSEMNNSLPFGGSVRISREMAALIRTIEALINSIANMGLGVEYESYILNALKGWLGIDEALARPLIANWPTLPARAGRMQIIAFLAAFSGLLTNAKGKPLLLIDGSPAKLGELLWFGPTGGVFDATASDRQTMKLTPQLVYGFDAIFSLAATDGRPLALPIFVAIQAQVNGSRPECLFGQPPLSEGWMRALIERLKDSADPQQNGLGERLEVALTNGRFHLGVLRGSVEDGTPIPQTFDLVLAAGPSRLLSAANPAFA